jgi:hypothetical protein
MDSKSIHLHKAKDAEDSWAINLVGDHSGVWRAQKGFGQNFEKVWSLELQSPQAPDLAQTDWDVLLDRAIEAYDMNDPIIAKFQWPIRQLV